MEGLRKLKEGDFNNMSQEPQPDGSVVITLSKRGEDKTYRFRVKNLYEENEKVLEHEVIDRDKVAKEKPWIAERMKQAKEEKEKEDKEKKSG